MNKFSSVIVALDLDTEKEALEVIEKTKDYIDIYKIGPVLFLKHGPSIVEKIQKFGKKVFLDMKLHDIPNTVKKSVQQASKMGIYMLTLHLSGGGSMLEAAVEGRSEKHPLLLGVSVLTSLEEKDLQEIGITSSTDEQVKRLTTLGDRAGIDGFVLSGREVKKIKALFPHRLAVVPGVRPAGENREDQKRTVTPKQAFERGADYIVVGRPIYQAKDIEKALKNLFN